LFSASPNKSEQSLDKDRSFVNDAEFMKFVQRSPLNLLRGKGKTDKEEQTMDILFTSISEMYKSDPNNHVLRAYYYQLKNACKQIKQDKVKQAMKEKKQNCKEFRKLLKKRSSTNDVLYFKKNFTPEQQAHLIEEIRAVNKISYSEVPYRLSVLQAPIPRLFKSIALNKISTLRNMDPGSGEFYKIKNWVDGFMKIPFDKEKLLPVTLETHGREACSAFMDNAKKQLDDAVYGLDDAKLQLMQLVGQWISNPKAMGTAVAIHGPPGTGKTSLIKEGVSKILGRDFAFIALGGATDSSFLEGHSYTYEGSTWGKIVDILIQCKSTNPVIYFDELDKISDTPKGDEIVGILTHLTDTTQNSQFHDKYFSEIVFDLSKCLFIFSYNDESRVNRVLLDRMYRIRTSGYNAKQKICITQNYLVPKIIEQVKFSEDEVVITPDVIEYIVENFTEKEEGVRNLKRCLEIIHTKLNLHRLMTPGAIVSMFPKEFKATNVNFPYTITRDNLEHLLKKNETRLAYGMYL
jgi:ATP-dependent Lon protease